MNREIKFRVWDKEYEEFSNWTNRDPFLSISSGNIFFWDRTRKEDGSYGGDIILQDTEGRFILQQFIGLKDKNGKEIYEGDIVRYDVGKTREGEIEYNSAPVVFSPFGHGFVLDSSGRHALGDNNYGAYVPIVKSRYAIDQLEYEVIGNIFENPELVNS